MDPATEAVTKLIATIGIAGIIGFAVGYALKKVFKLALIVLGIFLLGIFYFEYVGIIEIHYDKLLSWAESIVNTVLGYSSAIYNNAVASIPTAAGFAAGFALGFKKG
ncbi:MAG: hypothetical protein J7K58_05965 [Euryarchaeota archaeon]|nr:hypothetical protein [Euryarchaeota archaeon]